MVKETRITFEIGDILSFRLKCANCEAEIRADLEKLRRLVECPLCGEGWEIPNESSAVREVLRALRQLSRERDSTRTIRFEIDGEDKPAS